MTHKAVALPDDACGGAHGPLGDRSSDHDRLERLRIWHMPLNASAVIRQQEADERSGRVLAEIREMLNTKSNP